MNYKSSYNKLVAELTSKCKGCKTSKQVEDVVKKDLYRTYGRSARVDAVAEDLAESVCLRLNIDQE